MPDDTLRMSRLGFRRQRRRMRVLLLLAGQVPRLPRLALGLRLRLQFLVRLTTCCVVVDAMFLRQGYLSGAGVRDVLTV